MGLGVWGALSAVSGAEGGREPIQRRDVIFRLDLTDPSVISQLEAQGAHVVKEGPSGEPSLKIINADGEGANKLVSIPFDIEKVQGGKICFLADLKGEGIRGADPKVPLASWDGLKFQSWYESPSEGKKWTDESKLHGTFPWRDAGRIVGVTEDARNGRLNVGLGNAYGTAWISNVRIAVVEPPVTHPEPREDSPVYDAKTQLRGVMAPSIFKEKDFEDMEAWNVNVIRWHMQGSKWDKEKTYEQWLADRLEDLERALKSAQAHGIKVAVCLQDTPGDRMPDGTQRMFLEKKYQDQFVEIWKDIARRFKDYPALWAYDLVNEPVQNRLSPEGVDDWLELQIRTAKEIRKIDPDTPITLEVDQWDTANSFKWLQPLDIPHIIYQVHMYWPAAFTHQGVFTDQGIAKDMNMADSVHYPGIINGEKVDKEALRRHLEPVRKFQLAYGVPIFVGEFSAARWGPGAAQYINDCIEIFEEYGWDWAYHAFREWQGWDTEMADLPYGRDIRPVATEPTDRQRVLKEWLAKNQTSALEPAKTEAKAP